MLYEATEETLLEIRDMLAEHLGYTTEASENKEANTNAERSN